MQTTCNSQRKGAAQTLKHHSYKRYRHQCGHNRTQATRRMKEPTNSLILRNLDPELLNDTRKLVQLISMRHFNVELVSLPKFGRVIIICSSSQVAAELRDYLQEGLGQRAKISYSMRDNTLRLLDDGLWALTSQDTEYLELPLEDGSRRFLILPPLSPQNEWDDFDKAEEGPNKKSIYSPSELSHLLWDRLGGFDSSHVRRFQDDESGSDSQAEEDPGEACVDISKQPEVLFENIDNGVPAIILDKVRNREANKRVIPKTAIPPPLQ